MANEKVRFLSGVGRILAGDVFEPSMTNQDGTPRLVKTGPNAGQKAPQFFIAVGFPKMTQDPRTGQMIPNPEFAAYYAILDGEARKAWPQFFPTPGGPCNKRDFAWKYIDADVELDSNNRPYREREGYAGCWVVRFTSGFAPSAFHTGRWDRADQIRNPAEIRPGYYVRVAGTIDGNGSLQSPGMYVNHDIVELVGYGQEIISQRGPDVAAVMGAAPAPMLPAGASATPLAAPGGPGGGYAPPAPAPGPGPVYAPPVAPVAPGPVYAPPAAPPLAAPPPYGAYVGAPGPGGAPPPPPAPAAPPPPPAARQLLPAAGASTYDQYRQSGWTDAQLIAAGYMAP